MAYIRLISIFFFLQASGLLVACAEVGNKEFKEEEIFIGLSENQKYCNGIPVFDLLYPTALGDDELRYAILALYRNDKEILEVGLNHFESLGGTYICLEEKFLKEAYIVIAYGEADCLPYKKAFTLKNLEDIFKEKKLFFTSGAFE